MQVLSIMRMMINRVTDDIGEHSPSMKKQLIRSSAAKARQNNPTGAKRFLALSQRMPRINLLLLYLLVYMYVDGHMQVTSYDIIGCIYVVRVVVKQLNWSSQEILCSLYAYRLRETASGLLTIFIAITHDSEYYSDNRSAY